MKKLENNIKICYLANGCSAINSAELSINRFTNKVATMHDPQNLIFNCNYFVGCNLYLFNTKFNFIQNKINIYQNTYFDKYYLFMDFFYQIILFMKLN